METWRLFWAKTNREKIADLPDDWTHPLWAHLIDVGSAAQVLWDQFLPQSLKQKMADGIGMNSPEAGKFLSIWIGLHDLGKGIPSFQGIDTNGIYAAPTVVQQLAQAGLVVRPDANRLHHGHASIAIVRRWLHNDIDEERNGKSLPEFLLDALATCVGIHHGKLTLNQTIREVSEDQRLNAALGDAAWKKAQHDLAEAVFSAWGANWPDQCRQPMIQRGVEKPWPDWLMAFAGWATLADWLGSMQTCYDHTVQASDSLATYLVSSREGALEAFGTAGLTHQAALQVGTFEAHFGNVPRPLQEIARDMEVGNTAANLVIMEAPTGEGKTEAAFYLAGRFGNGIYAAMPSQSTSDGLYPRLKTFLTGLKTDTQTLQAAHVGDTDVAVRLVHGNDLLHDDALSLLLTVDRQTAAINDDDDETKSVSGDAGSKSRVLSWFMPKKRALLVPYGVGTVDQLFLGVLYAKHFFLRLFALCGKTIIFDEVHAYDTYMNTVFGRLLPWLRALDINVVVLSATLPGETRQHMLSAWGGQSPDVIDPLAPYPVAWQAAAGVVQRHPFKPDDKRGQQLNFNWCADDLDTIAEQARTMIEAGATVLVICNKVERAQQLFARLDDDALLPREDRLLLHARMPQAWRQQREQIARDRFGKDRPDKPGLLVGTQVIEQSLDLDADAMITDLAPVDLLLQRAGRLHRHDRTGRRPDGYIKPVLWIACPPAEAGELPNVDEVSASGFIYARKLLWQTWDVLQQKQGWSLPLGDGPLPGYRELIERVYTQAFTFARPLSQTAQQAYDKAGEDWDKQNNRKHAEADKRLVPPPSEMRTLFQTKENTLTEDDDNPKGSVPAHLQAFTRDPEGLNAEVLLMHPTPDGWSIEPGGETLLKQGRKQFMNPKLLRAIFGQAVRISNGGIVSVLWKEENQVEAWQKQQEIHKVLKRFQLIQLTNNTATINGIRLELNDRLGLTYPKTN